MGKGDSLRAGTDSYRDLGMGNSSVHMVLALTAQKACSIAINEGLVRLPRVDGVREPLAV
jgi:hypothetical protein